MNRNEKKVKVKDAIVELESIKDLLDKQFLKIIKTEYEYLSAEERFARLFNEEQ